MGNPQVEGREAEFKFFDSDVAAGSLTSFSEAYPCLDGKLCSRIELDSTKNPVQLAFTDAVNYCRSRGGQLAQLDTSTSATAYLAAVGSSGEYWTGGQQAWVYRDPQCDVVYNASCLTNAISSYRWLSDNTEFARADGKANAVWNASPSYFYGANQSTFATSLPKHSALVVNGADKNPALKGVGSSAGVVCEYPAADYDLYQSNTLGLELVAAAGFGISMCVPGDDIGICLGGELNVISFEFVPKFEHSFHQVYLKNRLVMEAGQTGFVGRISLICALFVKSPAQQ